MISFCSRMSKVTRAGASSKPIAFLIKKKCAILSPTPSSFFNVKRILPDVIAQVEDASKRKKNKLKIFAPKHIYLSVMVRILQFSEYQK